MRIVCISDTHGLHGHVDVPDGDVLVHAGDLTNMGTLAQVAEAASFIQSLPHRHKIVIAGNHDLSLEHQADEAEALLTEMTYLRDSATTVDGVRFWGSPWQPWFFDWAFNLQRGEEIRAKWDLIPDDTDVLITHGPPLGVLDMTFRQEQVGCADLLEALERTEPCVHVFGHIHEGYGRVDDVRGHDTTFVNASICTLDYQPVNAPIIVDL